MSSIILPPSSEFISDLIAAEQSRLQARGINSQPALLFLTLQLDSRDILGWLKAANGYPRMYWKNREGTLEFGGIGNALAHYEWNDHAFPRQIEEVQRLLAESEAPEFSRAFAGCAFDPAQKPDAVWADFPRQCIHLPELSVIRRGAQSAALVSLLPNAETNAQILDRILTLITTLESTLPYTASAVNAERRRDTPSEQRWKEIVSSVVDSIDAREIEKIVLARRTDLELERQPDAVDLLAEVSTRATNSYVIMYAPTAASAFLAISPERLLRCQDRTLSTEAVAGTIPRGQTEIEDLALENRLRNSLKDRSEQQFVVEGIANSLAPFCDEVEVSNAASVMKLQSVQHLISDFRAILKPDTSLGEIFAALHPTAAVCGTPREESRRMLAAMEGFDRGWYASGIGLVGADQAEFAVGIRSLVLRGSTLSVFTGAGIVDQSNPEVEWRELEDKLESIIGLRIEATS